MTDVGSWIKSAKNYWLPPTTWNSTGWCREEFFDDVGAVCLLGAISGSGNYDIRWIENTPAAVRLQNHLYESVGGYLVATWNDAHCESKEQAVALLRSAAYSS
jgi:hypothetical protein